MLNKLGLNNDQMEKIKKREMDLKSYLERELGEIIKVEGLLSNMEYLRVISEGIETKKEKIRGALGEIRKNQLENMDDKFEQKRLYQKLKTIVSEHERLSSVLSETDEKMEGEIRYLESVKKQVDRIFEEKERIISELFLLDVVRDMKLNGGTSTKYQSFTDKLKITENIKEIENHINLYEKELWESFLVFKDSIKEDFREILRREKGNCIYAKQLITYFFEIDMPSVVFEIIATDNILPLRFQDIPSTFSKSNLDNIRLILINFFHLAENFYKSFKLMDKELLIFFNESMFFKFTNFLFEEYLSKYFTIILGKNLEERKDQFYLDYLEKVHEIFDSFNDSFTACKDYSIYFYELLINNKNGVLEKYYEEYFGIEERFFNYRTNIYLSILKDKLQPLWDKGSNKQPFNFQTILDIFNNEKMEEYLDFIKKSIYRCLHLSRSSSCFYQINKLIVCSLKEFESFLDYILINISKVVPSDPRNLIFLDPFVFRTIEYLFVFLVRMNISQKNFISLIKGSNYFAETDEFRKTILENIRSKIISLNEKLVQNIFVCALNKFQSQKRANKVEVTIFQNILEMTSDFIQEIKDLTNTEIKSNIELIFYKNLIELFETLFFKYYAKYKKKINFHNEFKLFFECFNNVKIPSLERDIVAFKYFLLCLKSDDRDINKFIENTSNDTVNIAKIQSYHKFLSTL